MDGSCPRKLWVNAKPITVGLGPTIRTWQREGAAGRGRGITKGLDKRLVGNFRNAIQGGKKKEEEDNRKYRDYFRHGERLVQCVAWSVID